MSQAELDQLLLAIDGGTEGAIREATAALRGFGNRLEIGEIALERAISESNGHEGSLSRVHCLIALGARVHASAPDDCDTAMHHAASYGYTEVLRTLLDVGGHSVLGVFNDFQFTPLHSAAWKGHLEAVRFLLEAGSDVNRVDEKHIGDTALSLAVQEGHSAVVEMLLSHGADPTIPGWMRLTPMHHALEWEPTERTPAQKRIFELLQLHEKTVSTPPWAK